MTKKTEAKLDAWERDLYNEGQGLIKQGKEKMDKARSMANERIKRAEEYKMAAAQAKIDALIAGSNALMQDIIKSQGLGDYKYKVHQCDRVTATNGSKTILTITLTPR